MGKQDLQPGTSKRRCVVVGEQSLLIQCSELLLAGGYQIDLVVAEDGAIVDWCEGRGIPHAAAISEIQVRMNGRPFEYLFSLTNLKMLSSELIALPTIMAVNFHDGPLPAYAGLNAPVWALLGGENQHGITLHVITEGADRGDILVQNTFPIVPGETVFTLNAKCYQAGIEAFAQLLEQLASGSVSPRAQDFSQRTYFGFSDRPEMAAVLDWAKPVASLDALVRALDFSRYPNPLLLPKLWLGSDYLLVRQVEQCDGGESIAPGTLIAHCEKTLTVAAKGGALKLNIVTDRRGQSVDVNVLLATHSLADGQLLPVLTPTQGVGLSEQVSSLCRYEGSWKKRLQRAEPLEAPYARQGGNERPSWRATELVLSPAGLPEGADAVYVTAAFALLLGRLGCKSEYTLAYRGISAQAIDTDLQSFFAAVTPLPVVFDASMAFQRWLQSFSGQLQLAETQTSFLADLWAREPALASVTDCANYPVQLRRVDSLDAAPAPMVVAGNCLLIDVAEDVSVLRVHFDEALIEEGSVKCLGEQLNQLLEEIKADNSQPVTTYSIVASSDEQQLEAWNDTQTDYDRSHCVHQLFEQQVAKSPEQTAYIFEDQQLTYQQLNARANQLARHLIDTGVSQNDLVGIMVERSLDMVVALMAVHKAGCAYVPLDPVYPKGRLAYMVEDSGLKTLVTQRTLATVPATDTIKLVVLDDIQSQLASLEDTNLGLSLTADSLAYVIYTSGSTGKPKGVMVEHRNVINFFSGMDQRLTPAPGTWLAVTSISFDISVLEIFWTLARGLTVVLYADVIRQKTDGAGPVSAYPDKPVDFGLFYWNVATDESQYDQNKYKLLLEGAKYGDKNGFNAIWTPERHFAAFGGLFPNPAVTGAALAAITENMSVRAGSCVVPLHSPIRVAEEWAVVDNLSNGRAGIAIAAGWAPPDFAIKPENFADSKNVMFESAETVRKLWRGETLEFPGPDGKDVPVRTLPRPLQAELPLWVTTAGNIDSYTRAAEIGANVLTHLLGQTIEEVAEKVKAYRAAWKAAGHPGEGTITLMLHTFVGPDAEAVEAHVHQPLKDYLKSAMFLVKSAAWQFPTFKKMSEQQGKTLDEFFDTISDEDMDALLEFAFQRYFHTSGLFGTPESAMQMVDQVKASDIDEIACLIDFGINDDLVLEHLPYLNELREYSQKKAPPVAVAAEDYSLPALFERHQVSHFQCTPSMATMLAADPQARPGLQALKHMMVGGEAFPPELAKELGGLVSGRVTNMYGPTETTIWSSTGDVDGGGGSSVSIGRPLVNQQLHILDENQQRMPIGLAGELVIGGDGVVRGYHNRADLTEKVFIADSFSGRDGDRMYRTGDLARYLPDGRLECMGRVDHQVKIRGYRVELGEIEALLRQHQTVMETAVILREDTPGDKRLVAYVRCHTIQELDTPALKSFLKERLPEFMVPSIFVALHELPLTPNGKIDRKSLPRPQQATQSAEESKPPQNDAEIMLADIWKRALDVPSVGVRDNFFDIGGHSLLVIQVLKELNEKVSKPIKMTDLFKYTTIESLAGFLSNEQGGDDGVSQGQARAAARKASMGRRRRSRKR